MADADLDESDNGSAFQAESNSCISSLDGTMCLQYDPNADTTFGKRDLVGVWEKHGNVYLNVTKLNELNDMMATLSNNADIIGAVKHIEKRDLASCLRGCQSLAFNLPGRFGTIVSAVALACRAGCGALYS